MTTACFEIDWRWKDSVLKERFGLWLKNRPKEVTAWITKGKGRPAEQIRKLLKALGAVRLLRSMSWKDAADYTQEAAGKALFEDQSSWIRARKLGERAIRQYPTMIDG